MVANTRPRPEPTTFTEIVKYFSLVPCSFPTRTSYLHAPARFLITTETPYTAHMASREFKLWVHAYDDSGGLGSLWG